MRLTPWGQFLLSTGFILLAPALIRPSLKTAAARTSSWSPTKPQDALSFDGEPRRRLETEHPDYVLIGNSMLNRAIDLERLNQLAAGPRFSMLAEINTGAVHWYLAVKNHVAATSARPKAIFVFFRDYDLSERSQREAELRERWSLDEEPVFGDLARRECVAPAQRIRESANRSIEAVYPIAGWQRQGLLEYLVQWSVPGFVLGDASVEDFRRALNHRLDEAKPRPRWVGSPVEDDPFAVEDFSASIDCTFLSPMIDVAAAASIRLVLVRVQRHPGPHGPPPQDARLTRYIARLAEYAKGRGVGFLDFTGDPEMTEDLYAFDDHLAPHAMGRFSEIFLSRIRPFL